MIRLTLSLMATAALFGGLTTGALAASWKTINERQATLEQRINQGIRNGALTRSEAVVLRGDFSTLARLEENYRRSGGGLTSRERADLDQRFDRLSQRIRIQRHDAQDRSDYQWVPINQRQARIEARIDQGIRNGTITRTEAIELRGDFRTLVNLEAEYRRSRGAFTAQERADLEQRLERLSSRVASERRDVQSRY